MSKEETRVQYLKIILFIGGGFIALYILWDIRSALWEIIKLLK